MGDASNTIDTATTPLNIPLNRNAPLLRVTSRSSVQELRESGRLSGGASSVLMRRNSRRFSQRSQAPPATTTTTTTIGGRPTYITSLIQDMQWAFRELQCPPVETLQLEAWAIFVHESLSSEARGYHSVAHVFEIAAGANPLQLLAAIFRDIINHYIDGELSKRQQELIRNVFLLNNKDDACILQLSESEPKLLLIAFIFGFAPGDSLTSQQGLHKSLDVFLSAVAASRLLGETLSLKQTALFAVCLEATIPFRQEQAAEPNGSAALAVATITTTPLDELFARLQTANDDFCLELTDDEMVETVQWAADLANRNMGNMVTDDLAELLGHTWNLLPEQNVALRQTTLFTCTDFYNAIFGMVSTFQTLQRVSVYCSFRGVPDTDETNKFQEQLARNLACAVTYLQARLLASGVVVAVASLTGGDAPRSFFFGDPPMLNRHVSAVLGDKLPIVERADTVGAKYNPVVLDVLNGHGMDATFFEAGSAPFTSYLYQNLGDEGLARALTKCQVPFTSDDSALAFLQAFPDDVFTAVAGELRRFAVSRTEQIATVQANVLSLQQQET